MASLTVLKKNLKFTWKHKGAQIAKLEVSNFKVQPRAMVTKAHGNGTGNKYTVQQSKRGTQKQTHRSEDSWFSTLVWESLRGRNDSSLNKRCWGNRIVIHRTQTEASSLILRRRQRKHVWRPQCRSQTYEVTKRKQSSYLRCWDRQAFPRWDSQAQNLVRSTQSTKGKTQPRTRRDLLVTHLAKS